MVITRIVEIYGAAPDVITCITTTTPPGLFERGLKRLYQILPRFLALPLFLDGLWVIKMITNRRKHFFKDRHVFNEIRGDIGRISGWGTWIRTKIDGVRV